MSDTEKDKDVSCFTVDGVVAEMVIEVEENQKIGHDDLCNSPLKTNHSDKKDDSVNESKDSDSILVEKEENPVIELDSEKEDKEHSVEIIETEDKNESCAIDEKSEKENDSIIEDKEADQINQDINNKKIDQVNKNTEDKNSNEINEQKIVDNKSNDIKQQSLKNSQNLKKKRKSEELTMDRSMDNSKETDMPRYPEVKKRKVDTDSEEKEEKKDASTKKSVQNEKQTVKKIDTPKESVKVDINRSLRNRKSDAESDEKSLRSRKSDVENDEKSLRSRKSDIESDEKSASKQNVLRKLPFRKNKDAPDIPDLKPNVYWWNGVGEGQGVKLGDIPEIRGRIQKAKSIRALFRVLFFQWPTNGQDIVGEILKFNGFPFDKSSYEYTKRLSLMKIMLDKTIFHMCELLDIRKGDKMSNIRNILEFLLKPYAKIDPATDPSWQPVVVLEKIEIDDNYFDQSSSKLRRGRPSLTKIEKKKDIKSSFVTPTRSTRSSGPRIELEIYPDTEDVNEKTKEDAKSYKTTTKEPKMTPKESKPVLKNSTISGKRPVGRPPLKNRTLAVKDSKVTVGLKKSTPPSSTSKTKTSPGAKDEKAKNTPTVKNNKEQTIPTKKVIKPSSKESKTEEVKNNVSDNFNRRKKFNKTRKKINASTKKDTSTKETSNPESKEDSDEYEIEMTVDSGPDMDEDSEMKDTEDTEKNDVNSKKTNPENEGTAELITQSLKTPEVRLKPISTVTLSDSSETESAEETKLATALISSASKKSSKVPMKRKGKPLRHFPKISESIQNANFSALQRLHILLFGASDKAENLKSNILSFGGFPFLEGSDEWKQKHFLLSLLAQNNLREYLNLLCIPYAHDDQPTMINKLMKFLAVPSDELLENNVIQPIETEVVSSVLVDKSSPITPTPKDKGETKKKVKKKEEKKVSKRPRKILMSEEEARRLEANFAREQRALARQRKLALQLATYPRIAQKPESGTAPSVNMHNYIPQPKSAAKQPPISDPDQLNALLQTVYKRRALKAAGAVVSTPNKGQKTKLGDIENIKFLIVTSNLNDLEILHRLIYMLEASKSRIRKNILDFDGFGFNEDSPKYKHRMDYLNSLGYEASKRISFLLGLCPLNTNLPQTDLNELIMYFLMSPCKTKQTVPITQMPSDEPHIIVKSTAPLEHPIYIQSASLTTPVPLSTSSGISKTTPTEIIIQPSTPLSKTTSDENTIQHSTPLPKTGTQKAKKTFPSSSKISPVKKVLLPPSQSSILGVSSLGNKSQKMTLLNSVPAVPAYSLPKSAVSNSLNSGNVLNTNSLLLNTQKSPVNSLVKVPVSPGTKIQVLNQTPKVAVTDSATAKIPVSLPNIPISLPNVAGQVLQNQVLLPQIPNKNAAQPLQIQTPLLQGSKMLVKSPSGTSTPQEFIVQQQTPDGQQKIFKLIRLPPSHPLVSNTGNKPPVQQTVPSSPVQQQVLLTTNTPLPGGLPPGLVIMKNNSGLPQLQNLQILPNAPVKFAPLSTAASSVSSTVSSSQPEIDHSKSDEVVPPEEKESFSASANTSLDESMEILDSSDDSPPTDEDLFSSIQEIILSSNFEDITLRNVIERVAAQYPNHDLTHRHNYMKECVKKIIIGT